MPHNPEAFAEMVVITVKSALGPLAERLAAAEQSNVDLRARVQELLTLRDRVTVVETKASMTPAPVPVVESKPFDASPLIERLAANEIKLAMLGDVRERVAVMETKAAVPMVAEPSSVDLAPLHGRLSELANDVVTVRERLAAVEVRAQIPGPPGKDGLDGKHGQNGVDGLGFDDLSVEFDGDRTIELKMQRGAQVKNFPIVLPYMRQQGVYVEGKSYVRGDVVTWAGSQWHCEADTATKPGDGAKNWTLVVKRGRDGKDGRDAATVPVVSIGGKS